MALDLTKIKAAVARNRTVDGSAMEFIRNVPQLIRDAIAADDVTDATNLNALADDIEASTSELEAALTANTGGGGGSTPPEG